MTKFLLPTLILILAGCAQIMWVKPGATQADFGRDNYACMRSSMEAAPPLLATTESWSSSEKKDHSKDVKWQNSGGSLQTQDMNAGNRERLTEACLQSKGWQLQLVKDQ